MLALIPFLLIHGFRWAADAADYDGPARFAFAQFPSWFPFFAWMDETRISLYIKSTTWVFPLVETIHILALAVLLGSLFLIDLRLLGIAIRKWSPAQILEQLHSFINWSVIWPRASRYCTPTSMFHFRPASVIWPSGTFNRSDCVM